jgi:hypothetical protein
MSDQNKRAYSSTTSELDTSANALETSLLNKQKRKKKNAEKQMQQHKDSDPKTQKKQ